MGHDTTMRSIEALANGTERRSDAARIRNAMPAISNALSAGVYQRAIYDALVECSGLSLSFESFRRTLSRIKGRDRPKAIVPSGDLQQPEKPNERDEVAKRYIRRQPIFED